MLIPGQDFEKFSQIFFLAKCNAKETCEIKFSDYLACLKISHFLRLSGMNTDTRLGALFHIHAFHRCYFSYCLFAWKGRFKDFCKNVHYPVKMLFAVNSEKPSVGQYLGVYYGQKILPALVSLVGENKQFF